MYLDYKASCRYSLKLKPICFQQDHKSRWAAISNPKSNQKPSDNHRYCPVSKPENRTELDPFGYMYRLSGPKGRRFKSCHLDL